MAELNLKYGLIVNLSMDRNLCDKKQEDFIMQTLH